MNIFSEILTKFKKKLGVKLDRSVNVTCAIVASEITAKNVTQGQSEDERLATETNEENFFHSTNKRRKKNFFRLRPTPQKDFPVCICFLLFYRARGGEEKKKRKTNNNGARENWFERGKETQSERGRVILVRRGKVSAKFPAFVQNVFLSSTMNLSFFFRENIDGWENQMAAIDEQRKLMENSKLKIKIC